MPLHPTKAELVRQLAHFIVMVTGMHNHVGNVADYLKDPSFVPTKIRPVINRIGTFFSSTEQVHCRF
jgi:hypothetical protein